jgi:hypothetical protein
MRGAPHNRFAPAISTINFRSSGSSAGRPARVRPEHRAHRRRSHSRCQRITVSGGTRTRADRQRRQALASHTQHIRSRVRRRGRAARRSIRNCCRRARFSSTVCLSVAGHHDGAHDQQDQFEHGEIVASVVRRINVTRTDRILANDSHLVSIRSVQLSGRSFNRVRANQDLR